MIKYLKIFTKPKTYLYIVSAFLFVLFASYFLFRNWAMEQVLNKVQSKLESKGAYFTYVDAGFSGFSSFEIKEINLRSNTDTLFNLNSLKGQVNFWALLGTKLRLNYLELHDADLFVNKKDSVYNFSFLLNNKTDTNSNVTNNTSPDPLAKQIYSGVKRLFNLVPDQIYFNNLSFNYSDSLYILKFNCDSLQFKSGQIAAEISILENNKNYANWIFLGDFDPSEMTADIKWYAENNVVQLPFLQAKNKLYFGFDTAHFIINEIDYVNNELNFTGEAGFKNLLTEHFRISKDTVNFQNLSLQFNLRLNNEFLFLDSSSTAIVNEVKFHPFIQFPLSKNKVYGIDLVMEETSASNFFNALPKGLFQTIKGIECSGNLSYRFHLKLDDKDIDNVEFSSKLTRHNFKLIKYGDANLSKMNGEFVHHVYENGNLLRSFPVGPSHGYFTPFDQVPQNLINSILVNEDPSFFYHNGFIPEAIRESIAENYKAKRFKRGGSTISMQLIKNVFLGREKTILRKAEEALLVWLIESNRITDKQRMFEVYLNIIEWAPGIYGIGEASAFYFNKKPSQLSLSECLLLANLIPRPKAFRYFFESPNQLKQWVMDKSKFAASRMVLKEMLTSSDTSNLDYNVKLVGIAAGFIIPKDTVESDSTLLTEPDLLD